ncbi:MAG: glycoside hydrolase family 15 protein [Chloroherpetonaceae bacterium]|nr:glycoside hydrolase family 15 protein [Chthonomonadaceae bacterium]MDW8207525.1 glycoside hydrolase family 15 protein [Chloroherpetonaceae bacterium]
MPRPLVIANGNLLVACDKHLYIRDLTFPYIGLLNHLSGHPIRIGLWVSGQFAWLDAPAWRIEPRYEPDTLVTRSECVHPGMKVRLIVSDCVSHRDNILLRAFEVENRSDHEREVRLFLSHNFHIAETDIGDTAFYHPFLDAVVHYKRDNYFLISGRSGSEGIFQYTTGVKGFNGAEGTWRDAEDGWLSMHPVEQGSVDSTVSFQTRVPAGKKQCIQVWLCAGRTLAEVAQLHRQVLDRGFEVIQEQTRTYWMAWSRNEAEEERIRTLPPQIAELFRRSLLIIRTQIDNRGAVIAANDSDIMVTARAHYAYMWPRDGALVAFALDRLGYQHITRQFFRFCRRLLLEDRSREQAVFMHKYSADGSWGATWHPWVVDGAKEVPFQQDSTALVLWALWRHYERYRDLEFIEGLYEDFIIPTADFMARYRDPHTGLPLPSYDLWEERRGINAYTCGTVFGALEAAAQFARVFHDERAATYAQAAQEVRQGMEQHLWDQEAGRFARRILLQQDGSIERDLTLDSALYALFAFGAFSASDPRVEQTMRQTLSRLWVQTEIGGMARYENDYYFRRSEDVGRVPGNPWIICTLWAAQFYIAHAREKRDLDTPLGLLLWAAARATESGILPEQVHPFTGEHLSVSPLTWSHAEFVSTTVQYLDRLWELQQGSLE